MYIDRLLGLMKENGDKQADLAEILELTPQGLSKKLTGKTEFKANELKKISSHYDVTIDYFFSEMITKTVIEN